MPSGGAIWSPECGLSCASTRADWRGVARSESRIVARAGPRMSGSSCGFLLYTTIDAVHMRKSIIVTVVQKDSAQTCTSHDLGGMPTRVTRDGTYDFLSIHKSTMLSSQASGRVSFSPPGSTSPHPSIRNRQNFPPVVPCNCTTHRRSVKYRRNPTRAVENREGSGAERAKYHTNGVS